MYEGAARTLEETLRKLRRNMKLLLQRFYEICLLRVGPQDLPASNFLLGLVLLVYMVLGVVLSSVNLPLSQALITVPVDTALMGLLTFFLLWVRDLPQRFRQVYTALLGTGAFFQILAFPLLVWQQDSLQAFQESGMQEGQTGVFVSTFALWLVVFWNVVVIGHIVRHALSSIMLVGMALAVLYMFISISTNYQLNALLSGGTT